MKSEIPTAAAAAAAEGIAGNPAPRSLVKGSRVRPGLFYPTFPRARNEAPSCSARATAFSESPAHAPLNMTDALVAEFERSSIAL